MMDKFGDYYDLSSDEDADISKNLHQIHISDTNKVMIRKKAEQSVRIYQQWCDALRLPVCRAVHRGLMTSKIRIPHRKLGAAAMKPVANALLKNNCVTTLNISDNEIGEEGIQYITDLLLDNEIIHYLDISQNNVRNIGARLIGHLLLRNTTIMHLDLSRNNISDTDGRFLAPGIERNKFVVTLDLSGNGFQEEGAQLIGKALGKNNNLESVNLSWNSIRLKGAVTLCRALESNLTLRILDLSHNGFGYEGALALAEMLKLNQCLRDIDVSSNRINWQGALFISEGLRKNTTLLTLKMIGNPLTTTGCQDLLEAIALSDSGVTMLDLSDIPVIGEFEIMTRALKTQRPSFKCKHGRVVPSHDVLGQRLARQVDPMQKVIDYMTQHQIRPTELFRSFDKNVMFNMEDEVFISRLKQSGIQLQRWEIQELMRMIEDQEKSEGNVNYVGLVHSVKDQVVTERNRKITQRENERRLAEYHSRILNPAVPAPVSSEVLAEIKVKGGAHKNTTKGVRFKGRQKPSAVPLGKCTISMSSTLGEAAKKPKRIRRKSVTKKLKKKKT